MRSIYFVAAFAGLLVSTCNCLLNAGEPPQIAGETAWKKFDVLRKEWMRTEQVLRDEWEAAKSSAERQAVLANKRPDPKRFSAEFIKLSDDYPGTRAEVEALLWILAHAESTDQYKPAMTRFIAGPVAKGDLRTLRESLYGEGTSGILSRLYPNNDWLRMLPPSVFDRAAKETESLYSADLLMWVCEATEKLASEPESNKLNRKAWDLLVARFPDAKNLWQYCDALRTNADSSWAQAHLRTLLAKNKLPIVQVEASFALAGILQNEDAATQAEAERFYRRVIGEEARAVAEWNKLMRNSMESNTGASESRAETAEGALKEMNARGLGKPAPELAGECLDGRSIKLSDYRGKVVLISSWATWCAPCMALVPHERELAKNRKGKPFVLLGVNGDKDPAHAAKVAVTKEMIWPSFKSGRNGAVVEAWGLYSWPTLYLIDHQGIIRKRWVGAPDPHTLEREIDRLIVLAEAGR